MATDLREYQARAMDRLRDAMRRRVWRVVLQAATGSGKTRIAAAVVDGALAKDKRVVFCVPALSLVDQTVEMFWREGIGDVGVIQANHQMTDWSKPVQVASVQTLMRRNVPEAHVVIVDEVHRLFDFYGEWMARPEWEKVPFIGLSATPWTRGLGKFYKELIIAASTKELIAAGYLSPFRVFAPAHPDLEGVRTVAGDYHEGDLGEAMDKSPLVADIVDTWIRRGEDRPTFCFAVNRAHAKNIQEKFDAAGVNAVYMDAYTDPAERAEVKKRFHAGEVKVVCNVGVLTTGVDWDVRCIVLARPTKSEMLFVQIVGRGLRTADGKKDLLVLDHSDSHLRLGFVDDIHHEKLDEGKERAKAEPRKEPLPKECPQCAYLRPPRTPKCPNCGFLAAPAGIEEQDGELQEMTPGKRPKAAKATAEDKARFYAMLLGYARDKGYKSGWASNKFREKFDVWPNAYRGVTPMEPDYRMLNWIKSMQHKMGQEQAQQGGAHAEDVV